MVWDICFYINALTKKSGCYLHISFDARRVFDSKVSKRGGISIHSYITSLHRHRLLSVLVTSCHLWSEISCGFVFHEPSHFSCAVSQALIFLCLPEYNAILRKGFPAVFKVLKINFQLCRRVRFLFSNNTSSCRDGRKLFNFVCTEKWNKVWRDEFRLNLRHLIQPYLGVNVILLYFQIIE